MIPNVLAQRYASTEMNDIWSAEGRILLERQFWIAVMKAQKELGLAISDQAIADYEKVVTEINVESIAERERITRHDVKARIEEFNDLAGHEEIHKGMTSRDLTENVEQLQSFRALELVARKTATTLIRIGERCQQWRDLVITARTHNVAAQPTTFGKRLAMFGEELHVSLKALEQLISVYPVRGLKGAVGTQMDSLSLFDGDKEKVLELEKKIIQHLGIPQLFTNVGQVYPRSLDLAVVSCLNQIASAPSSFCKTLRLMAGHETASEGFAKGQTGSSAMPHKMNSRSCERINGLRVILGGYLTMASSLAGDQWNEGDVSCSVVRRVMLPDAFLAIDGLFETLLTILNQMDVYEEVIASENRHYMPFLMTTTVMMEAVKAGAGRETAHHAIKKHAVATVKDLRNGTIEQNDLMRRLADDPDIPLDDEALASIMQTAHENTGLATEQIDDFMSQLEDVLGTYKLAGEYKPSTIL
ncbi:adenylosuccinate lyase [Mariniblastus fucicola]|uniref:Adenylosuccinate lyase n=1 Tax=Mariniblastus fucicola TaxID=980251 RepID=A0A5B9PIG3_9BACT|nr:adenylosuccinate lyase [Mariniblastus fucicola]QEG22551.1 Adenylosuccinate lyase [Mariniblastus fucicola]